MQLAAILVAPYLPKGRGRSPFLSNGICLISSHLIASHRIVTKATGKRMTKKR